MKRALFFLLILTLALLTGCGREAKEPVPEWPDRLAGEYDDTLTFTYRKAEPAAVGVDSLTGRMTALFTLEDGSPLALGWRHVAGAEVELLEDYLAGTDWAPGIWEKDSGAPNALESYVRLGRSWFCLTAAWDSTEDLTTLVDGTVEASANGETAQPRAASSLWLEELPWEEDWPCLLLGYWELEPEAGKEALYTLFHSYDWLLVDPAAADRVYDPELGMIRALSSWEIAYIHMSKDGHRQLFQIRENGDVYWNGTLRRPLGNGGGADLLESIRSLELTGEYVSAPPSLTISGGETDYEPIPLSGNLWTHVYRSGYSSTWGGFDLIIPYTEIDWFATGDPVLKARGELRLDFAGREPDSLELYAWTKMGHAQVEVREGRFAPFAGVNAYMVSCRWDKVAQGGYGSGSWILLIDGSEDSGPDTAGDGETLLTVTEADGYGCAFTLVNQGERHLAIDDYKNTAANAPNVYTLLRRTEAGGWAWVQPQRYIQEARLPDVRSGHRLEDAWDWSYAYGILPAGEYCLQLRGTLTRHQKTETVLIRGTFTVSDSLPPDLGPLTLCSLPEGIQTQLEMRSPHRWMQSFTPEATRYGVELGFSLYRLENGQLDYVDPEYRLPEALSGFHYLTANNPCILDTDLAAQYGKLPAGTYVLRRRFIRFTEEEWAEVTYLDSFQYPLAHFREWREVPQARVIYGDTVFTLEEALEDVPLPVKPIDPYRYTGDSPLAPVNAENAVFGSAGAMVTWRAEAEGEASVHFGPGNYTLYFRYGEEWFPLEGGDSIYAGDYYPTLAPGEASEECNYNWSNRYSIPLAPGDYRLLSPCNILPREGGMISGYAAADFTIPEQAERRHSP
ncbi:MAG: hypothetical protein IKG89_03795 [Oscillospiraceae bacterium]|nr:hypothetical protein [Oscillospiraceae bacterium]